MNGLISLISTVAGAALFFHKNKDVDDKGGNTKTDTSTLDPTESSYQEYKQKVEEAQAQQQANDPRNKTMYLGDPTAPYDPFYDYSDDVYTPLGLANLDTNIARVKACRFRFVEPYLLSEEVMKDGSVEEKMRVIGCPKPVFTKDLNVPGVNNLFRRYTFDDFTDPGDMPTAKVDGSDQFVVNIARGNIRYVTFYIEVFNPCPKEVEVKTFGVENVKVGDNNCQPMHLGNIPSEYMMGEKEREGRLYMYDAAYKWDKPYGNIGYFAARELRVEPIKANGKSADAKLLKMGYKYVPCDNVANNGYQFQKWNWVYAGRRRTGWATEDGKTEVTLTEQDGRGNYKSEDYKPSYLKVSPKSSRIVKMTLPLASIDDTKVYYAPEGELFDWDFRKGKIEQLHNFIGIADSEFLPYNVTKLTDQYAILSGIAQNYYTMMHNRNVRGYLRYDIKPAPSLSGKIFSLKLSIWGAENDYIPTSDLTRPYDTSPDNGVSYDLQFIPTKRPTNMAKEWRNSYFEDITIPKEDMSRQTQLGLIDKKFDYKYQQTFAEAFDASANN